MKIQHFGVKTIFSIRDTTIISQFSYGTLKFTMNWQKQQTLAGFYAYNEYPTTDRVQWPCPYTCTSCKSFENMSSKFCRQRAISTGRRTLSKILKYRFNFLNGCYIHRNCSNAPVCEWLIWLAFYEIFFRLNNL